MSTRPKCVTCGITLTKWTTATSFSRHLTVEGLHSQIKERFFGYRITSMKKSPHIDTWVGLWDGKSWGYDGNSHFHSMRCAAEFGERAVSTLRVVNFALGDHVESQS